MLCNEGMLFQARVLQVSTSPYPVLYASSLGTRKRDISDPLLATIGSRGRDFRGITVPGNN